MYSTAPIWFGGTIWFVAPIWFIFAPIWFISGTIWFAGDYLVQAPPIDLAGTIWFGDYLVRGLFGSRYVESTVVFWQDLIPWTLQPDRTENNLLA